MLKFNYLQKLAFCFFIFLIWSSGIANAGKTSDLRKIDNMYKEGLLTKQECIKAKKKILGSNSSPICEGKTASKKIETYSSQGSAFFITQDGYLLTNQHVIESCDNNVKIKYKREEKDVTVIAQDKYLDLALLQLKGARNTGYLKLANKEPEKLQRVIAVGFPWGKFISDDLKFTSGIISSIKGVGDDSTRIQIDAALNPGNSGGPIVDEETGELVGIAVQKMDTSVSESTNFAIKASSVKNFLSANGMKTSLNLISFSKSRSSLLKLLEKSTVFTYCE